MKEKNEIIKEFKNLISNLKKHNKYYYVDDSPKITDAEYDELKNKLLNYESKYPYVREFGTISNIVGAEPSKKFKKIKHLLPMLSLNNAFNEKDMGDFIKKDQQFS